MVLFQLVRAALPIYCECKNTGSGNARQCRNMRL